VTGQDARGAKARTQARIPSATRAAIAANNVFTTATAPAAAQVIETNASERVAIREDV